MAVSNAKANVASTNVWSSGAQNALIFLSAALSNMYASAVSNPLDIIKVRQQLKMQTTGGAANSFWAIGAEMARTEGALSLMNGLTASMLREFSYSGIRMGTYDFFKDTFSSMSGGRLQNDGLALKLLSATVASTLGSAIANPTDLVKVRMQAYSPTGRPYATTRAAFTSVWREGGFRALYRGADATTARGVVLTVSQICSYDQIKQIFKRRGLMEEGLPLHATVSMIAGFVCSVASNPVDVVKVRVMNDKERRYRGVVDCVRQIMTNEGPRAFFKGFPMCWARLGAHTVLTFVAFERLRMWFGIRPM